VYLLEKERERERVKSGCDGAPFLLYVFTPIFHSIIKHTQFIHTHTHTHTTKKQWEIRQGRSLPVFDGIVVLTKDVPVLLDAYHTHTQQKEEKAIKAKEKRVVERWARLVKGARIAAEIQRKYGGKKK
jgi:hypothetical protein